jgi:hypothetical protein
MAEKAYRAGLAVTSPGGDTRPIPITATPVVLSEQGLLERCRDARHLSSAAAKMASAILSGPQAEVLLSALSPLERRMAQKTHRATSQLATARVDCFVEEGRAWALEVNATIPAMQAYSDIAANTFIEEVCRDAGLSAARAEQLISANGSNARALYEALLQVFERRRGGPLERMGILCRPNDAQITELRYLARKFSEWGTECDVLFPDQLSGETQVMAHGKPYPLLYRHLFVRRLEEQPSPYTEALLLETPGDRAVVVNPPASQVEVKTTFALLSESAADGALAASALLSDEERETIVRAVPWTRRLRRAAGRDPQGNPVRDLVAFVAAHPQDFVLKRGWDYGGKAVFIGQDANLPSFRERASAAFGDALDWQQLCARAADDSRGGGFVVQKRVASSPERHLLCAEGEVHPIDLFVDFSAYASVGLDGGGWGGVCRGSPSQIVNIVGGGGMLPLLKETVARQLWDALAARR